MDQWGWFSDGDQSTVISWRMKREVYLKDGQGQRIGCISVDYEGLARATKDVDYESDGREVEWKNEAKTANFKISLELNGRNCNVTHDLHPDNWSQGGNYSVDCGGSKFQFNYISNWGLDEVEVQTSAEHDPVLQMGVGFVLAYWLHPKRAEDVAAQHALTVLQQRVGSW